MTTTTDRPITPMDVERRLIALAHEVDEAYEDVKSTEMEYHTAKATYEIEYARAILKVQGETAGERVTAAVKEARALLMVEAQRMALATAEAMVRASRENARRLQTQVDLARSVGTTVRSSLEVS